MADNEEELLKERKKCNEDIDRINNEIQSEIDLRDKANSEVKKIKLERDELTKVLSQSQREINELLKKEPVKDYDRREYIELKKQHERMNWKYQTEPMSASKERAFVKELDMLEGQLLKFEEFRKYERQIRKLKRNIAILRRKVLVLHKKVLQFADESEKHHMQVSKLREKLKVLYSEKKEYDMKINEFKSEDSKIRNEAKQYQESKLEKAKQKIVSKAKEIMEKFKSGEKITAEELNILQEADIK